VERLTGLDGAFLSLESPTTHLQILGALVFDPVGVEGGVDFWTVRNLISDRLPLVPPFRQRMVEVPFGLQHPALVDDPEFDLDFHVRRARLPEPGGRAELADLVADLASRPLDRGRPLWEFHVVEGLEHGRLAIVPKVHHAIIDGVSGAQVMAAFFDLSPVPAPVPLFGRPAGPQAPAPRAPGPPGSSGPAALEAGGGPAAGAHWAPDALPGEVERWRDVLGSLPGQAEAVVRTVSRSIKTVRDLSGRDREESGPEPPAPFEAPRTSINRAISPHRRVALAELSLNDVQRVRQVLGGTTNDVVLAVTSGALRGFFAARDEQPRSSLVGMVPVSVRTEEEDGALGNRVSAMLVSLATTVDDPVARLRRIVEESRRAKEQSRFIDPGVFAGWAQALVPSVATRLTRLITNLRVFDHVAPLFNLIVSNVPGPDVPLYLAGARMVSMYPVGPIIEGVGMNVTVFSYLDHLYVGVQGCRVLVPDIEAVARGMEGSLAELVGRANRRDRPVPWWHAELPA
jgi:WS/DGAT/MGAT family acyltransferase